MCSTLCTWSSWSPGLASEGDTFLWIGLVVLMQRYLNQPSHILPPTITFHLCSRTLLPIPENQFYPSLLYLYHKQRLLKIQSLIIKELRDPILHACLNPLTLMPRFHAQPCPGKPRTLWTLECLKDYWTFVYKHTDRSDIKEQIFWTAYEAKQQW